MFPISRYKAPLVALSSFVNFNVPYFSASRVLAALNKDVNPCEDFYEFACGGWIKKNPVPEWSTSWDQLALLREQLVTDLRQLLEEKDDDNLPKSVLKAKALYRTCVDVGKIHENTYVWHHQLTYKKSTALRYKKEVELLE